MSLVEALNAEFDKIETPEVETPEVIETPEVEEKETDDRPRDEHGRFSPKATDKATDKPTDAPAEKEAKEETPEPEKYVPIFNGYNQQEKETLSALPPEIQKIIDGRQLKFEDGIHKHQEIARQHQEKAEIADHILGNILAPEMPLMQQYNTTPAQYIQSMVTIERQLRSPDLGQRLAAIHGIAHDYGIDLNLLSQVNFDPHAHNLQKQLDAQNAQLNAIKANSQKAESEQLTDLVGKLRSELEYFDDLKSDMAQVIQAGLATGNSPEEIYKNAYDKALRLNGTVFDKIQASRQTQSKQKAIEANKAAQQAKSRNVSAKGGSPAGKTIQQAKSSITDQVAAQFDALGL